MSLLATERRYLARNISSRVHYFCDFHDIVVDILYMNSKRSLFIGLMLFGTIGLLGQDTQFYQAFSSPLTLNPGTTGMVSGNYRISSIYRDQWRAVVEQPVSTFSVSGDTRFSISKKQDSKDFIGVGVHFLSDKIGFISFTTNQLGVSVAYHKSLNHKLKEFLSFGAKFGITQRNINYENLNFEDEFNGLAAYTDPTGEPFAPNNFGFVDLAIGLNYQVQPFKGFSIYAGGAWSHINAPNIVFDKEDENLPVSTLYKKIQVYTGFSYDLNRRWTIKPRANFIAQGPHQQLILGSHFNTQLTDKFSESVEFGIATRLVNDFDGIGPESVIASFGLDLKGKVVGFSYEFNVQTVNNNFRNQGVFELSFTYIGEYDNEVFFCPEF